MWLYTQNGKSVSELNPLMKVERFENINKIWKVDFLKVIQNNS